MKSQMPNTPLGPANLGSILIGVNLLGPLHQIGRLDEAPFDNLAQPGHLDGCEDPICLADRYKLLEAEAVVRLYSQTGFGPRPGQVFWQLNEDKNLPGVPACKYYPQSGVHHLGTCHWCTLAIHSPLPQPGAKRNDKTCVCRIRVRAARARTRGASTTKLTTHPRPRSCSPHLHHALQVVQDPGAAPRQEWFCHSCAGSGQAEENRWHTQKHFGEYTVQPKRLSWMPAPKLAGDMRLGHEKVHGQAAGGRAGRHSVRAGGQAGDVKPLVQRGASS